MHLGVWSDARGYMCNGIGETKKNIDEMDKKTDAICILLFWSGARDTCAMASVKRRKTSMKWPKRPVQYALGCLERCTGYMCNGIVETTKNVGEMAKKTDAICISVFGAVHGMIDAWDR
jgi:hypothetical protein